MKQDSPNSDQLSFMAPDLLDQLNPKHPLLQLANTLPWDYFEAEFAPLYSPIGRPAKPIRLMVGLCILKHLENLSDERVVQLWIQSPYYQAFYSNQYDGHTLPEVLLQLKRLINYEPAVALCDRGYKGSSKINDTHILRPNSKTKDSTKNLQALMRKRFRKRAGIEPVIGHLKSDHRLNRNYLKGFVGDQINVLMAAAAFNFRKWMRLFFLCL